MCCLYYCAVLFFFLLLRVNESSSLLNGDDGCCAFSIFHKWVRLEECVRVSVCVCLCVCEYGIILSWNRHCRNINILNLLPMKNKKKNKNKIGALLVAALRSCSRCCCCCYCCSLRRQRQNRALAINFCMAFVWHHKRTTSHNVNSFGLIRSRRHITTQTLLFFKCSTRTSSHFYSLTQITSQKKKKKKK